MLYIKYHFVRAFIYSFGKAQKRGLHSRSAQWLKHVLALLYLLQIIFSLYKWIPVWKSGKHWEHKLFARNATIVSACYSSSVIFYSNSHRLIPLSELVFSGISGGLMNTRHSSVQSRRTNCFLEVKEWRPARTLRSRVSSQAKGLESVLFCTG